MLAQNFLISRISQIGNSEKQEIRYNNVSVFLKYLNFPSEKQLKLQISLSESELMKALSEGQIVLPPVRFKFISGRIPAGPDLGYDGILAASWDGRQARYAYDYKRASHPGALKSMQIQIRAAAQRIGLPPLIIVPYLGEQALDELETARISGIDLCGNGILLDPDFLIRRTGQPNRFKETRSLKNPYNGDSSIFARCFLLRSYYESLAKLHQFALALTFSSHSTQSFSALTLSTASKTTQALADDLIIAKSSGALKLLDMDLLLSKLRQNFREASTPNIIGKTMLSPDKIWDRLALESDNTGLRSVTTGRAAASRYHVLSGKDTLSLYVDNLDLAAEILEITPGRAFANVQIFQSSKNLVYFDTRRDGNIPWSSPIQTWLDLSTRGPREQEAAQDLERILRNGQGETL